MNYNEWRDELKNNLLNVSDAERKRVLEYYAEAYADRREAGYSENEICASFGAPYDAAKRILSDNGNFTKDESTPPPKKSDDPFDDDKKTYDAGSEFYAHDARMRPPFISLPDNCLVRCLLFFGLAMLAVPIIGGLMAAAGGLAAVLIAVPASMIIGGVATAAMGIGALFTGELLRGFMNLGFGIMIFGIGTMLASLSIYAIKFIVKYFKKVIRYLSVRFFGRARV